MKWYAFKMAICKLQVNLLSYHPTSRYKLLLTILFVSALSTIPLLGSRSSCHYVLVPKLNIHMEFIWLEQATYFHRQS